MVQNVYWVDQWILCLSEGFLSFYGECILPSTGPGHFDCQCCDTHYIDLENMSNGTKLIGCLCCSLFLMESSFRNEFTRVQYA